MSIEIDPPFTSSERRALILMSLALVVAMLLLGSWIEGQANRSAQQWQQRSQDRSAHVSR